MFFAAGTSSSISTDNNNSCATLEHVVAAAGYCVCVRTHEIMEPYTFDGPSPLLSAYQRGDDAGARATAYKKRAREDDADRSAAYAARTPEPAYAQFGVPQYVDARGREYTLAGGTARQLLVRAGDITTPEFVQPDRERRQRVGKQLFWMRLPRTPDTSVAWPDADGEQLWLYFWRTQVLCRGVTDGVYLSGGRKKTGHVVLRNFVTLGQVADPSEYEHLLPSADKPRRSRRLL